MRRILYPVSASPPRLPKLRHGLAGGQRHLDSPHQLGLVVRMDQPGCRPVKPLQHPMQMPRIPRPQTFPQLRLGRRGREQPVQQRPQVKPGSPRHDGKTSSLRDSGQRLPSHAAEVSRRERLGRVHHVDEVMGNPRPVLQRWLGRPDLHPAIHRDRVAGDDLPAKAFRQPHRQSGLSACCRPCDHHQRARSLIVYQSRHHPTPNTRCTPARNTLKTSTPTPIQTNPRICRRRSGVKAADALTCSKLSVPLEAKLARPPRPAYSGFLFTR